MTDVTLRENPSGDSTLREAWADGTVREGAPEKDVPTSVSIEGRPSFRGMAVLEQLPTRGAEADIYLLRDEAGERCILKLYRHRLEPKLEVLERIREISRAHSRHFVVFRDAGFDEATGRWFELQEYLPLGSLKDVPDERKRDPEFVRGLVSELAGAIHCLHENNIVHCDIKPGNVLVRSLDPLDLVLTDFGISSILAADVSQKMTSLKGTPMYWAPEAFSRLTGRPGDWWGLGMMVLELLSGEHPFAGLTDSQIIHRLTIGNADIPDSLADEWKLLLRGLLTKDDSKRWGYGQVARWLAGERDIPVHDERPAMSVPTRQSHAFRFEGRDYRTPEELARMLCEREQPWAVAPQFLRYIRSWFESNMQFDEAVELGNDMDRLESEMALFRFVHRYAKGPFVYLGKVIDANNLRLFLARTARQEAGFSEQRIVRMLGDGSLLTLYDDYAGLTGKNDPLLRRIIALMDKRPPEEQWRCFEVLDGPAAFLWPKDLEDRTWSTERVLDALERVHTVPMKKSDFESLRAQYVLPGRLTEMLASSDTHAAGVAWLNTQKDRELLILRDSDPYGAMYERMELDGYAERARVVCMGHTPAFMEKLEAVREAFEELPPFVDGLEQTLVGRALERLDTLRCRRVTRHDTFSVGRLSKLFDERRKLLSERQVMYLVSGCAGAIGLWLFTFLTGETGVLVLRVVFAIAFVGVVVFVLRLQRNRELARGGEGSRRNDPATVLPLLGIVGFFIITGVIQRYSLSVSLLMGAMLGCGAWFCISTRALFRNLRRIAEACGEYCGGEGL